MKSSSLKGRLWRSYHRTNRRCEHNIRSPSSHRQPVAMSNPQDPEMHPISLVQTCILAIFWLPGTNTLHARAYGCRDCRVGSLSQLQALGLGHILSIPALKSKYNQLKDKQRLDFHAQQNMCQKGQKESWSAVINPQIIINPPIWYKDHSMLMRSIHQSSPAGPEDDTILSCFLALFKWQLKSDFFFALDDWVGPSSMSISI